MPCRGYVHFDPGTYNDPLVLKAEEPEPTFDIYLYEKVEKVGNHRHNIAFDRKASSLIWQVQQSNLDDKSRKDFFTMPVNQRMRNNDRYTGEKLFSILQRLVVPGLNPLQETEDDYQNSNEYKLFERDEPHLGSYLRFLRGLRAGGCYLKQTRLGNELEAHAMKIEAELLEARRFKERKRAEEQERLDYLGVPEFLRPSDLVEPLFPDDTQWREDQKRQADIETKKARRAEAMRKNAEKTQAQREKLRKEREQREALIKQEEERRLKEEREEARRKERREEELQRLKDQVRELPKAAPNKSREDHQTTPKPRNPPSNNGEKGGRHSGANSADNRHSSRGTSHSHRDERHDRKPKDRERQTKNHVRKPKDSGLEGKDRTRGDPSRVSTEKKKKKKKSQQIHAPE